MVRLRKINGFKVILREFVFCWLVWWFFIVDWIVSIDLFIVDRNLVVVFFILFNLCKCFLFLVCESKYLVWVIYCLCRVRSLGLFGSNVCLDVDKLNWCVILFVRLIRVFVLFCIFLMRFNSFFFDFLFL